MDVTPLIREGQQVIQSYAGGRFRISGHVYESPVIVTAEKTFSWNLSASFEDFGEEDFSILSDQAADIDVILLGTGRRARFMAPDLRQKLRARGFVIEIMDTGAACRTYNVLMAEGRRVAAALLPAS